MKDITPNPFSQTAIPSEHHKTHTLVKAIGVFTVLVLVVLLVLMYQKRAAQTSKSQLDMLEQVSDPVRTSKQEQLMVMEKLQAEQKTSLTTQERQDMLDALQ
jgi:cell division protein FtsX